MRPDVIVVGSGAGGAAFAWAMSKAGARVQILEAGPAYNPSEDYRLHRADWELQQFPAKLEVRGRQTHAPLQELDQRWDHIRSWNHLTRDEPKRNRRLFSGYHHVIGVGGSTVHYTGEAHRMNPLSMQMKSRFGVAADWPVSYAELEPYYCQAERIIGVAGPGPQGTRTRSEDYPVPAHPLSYTSQVLGRGFDKLGLSWQPNPVASLSRAYDGRPPCNYCGQCTRGCPRYDKGSADITFIRKAVATGNCDLQTIAQVLKIETAADDRVAAVVYADAGGTLHRAEADLFAIGCGAIETPRLLLNSAGPACPDGLANESGQVGRNFMETLSFNSMGLHPDPVGSHRGLPSDAICWDFNAPDAIDGVTGGCRISPSVIEMNLAGPYNYARRVVGGWGRQHRQAMREQFGRVVGIGVIGESLPGPGSFIDLDPSRADEQGMPKARIHSLLEDMEIRRIAFMADKAREILAAAGVQKIIEERSAYDTFSSTQVFGTCRMGNEPGSSVVDAQCRSHRWRNLMVVDASVFPSSGGGESPSLTISANALRVAAAAQSW